MLKFLGVGAAYNFKFNNNCAYFIENDTLYLFDCGEKICDKILKTKLLNNVKKVCCFVTHLHSDHVGSLEPLMYYLHYIDQKEIQVFYPYPKRLKKLLILMGIEFDFEIYDDFSKVKEIRVEPVRQKHIFGSFGYFVYSKQGNFFYSGDTSIVNKRAVGELKNGKIDAVYHEVTIVKEAKIHTHISKLENCFPKDLRNKVYLMHLANAKTIATAKKLGFSICTEIK